MNKTEIKEKKEKRKEKRSEILGVTAFFAALIFIISIGSLGFYW
ncbi:unnamed protein product [marine sediment metagenome]|uniref:Uncharacterized protein n=1 Tax=marine sediment metagenome TaxID=412755 RepID=X1DS97_9ZZZZ